MQLPQADLGSPALAFSLALTEVLRLDETVADEVARLKANLLALLHVPEYSRQATFKVRLFASELGLSISKANCLL